MDNLVSVIMPTFNVGSILAESIESILNQTYKNIELLITDDASTDETTRELLRHYAAKDERVDVLMLDSNFGPGYARNKCIERAKGRFIAFCDADDMWFPEKIEKQVTFMKKKNCPLCYSSYILCDCDGNENGIFNAPDQITLDMIKRDNKIGCLTAVYDAETLGGKQYMPVIRKRQDWALFMSILKQCGVAYGITEPLACYRQSKKSVSHNKLSLIKYNARVYQKILGYSKLKSYLYLIFCFAPSYGLKVLKKKIDSINYMKNKKNR